MIKLIVLIIASIILLTVFIVILIFAFIKKTKRLFILSVLSFVILFCTGIYILYFGLNKGKEKTFEIAKTAAEKVFPTFDSDIPDTEANKKNFRNFLKVDITPDVKNIYCFDDTIGQDADYMFAFSCDSLTANKIIDRNELKNDSLTGNNPENLQHSFFWWDNKRINELQRYSWDSDAKKKNFHKLFWYDQKNKKAYYFEFDM
jgi:energy-coupling factor transporter transmembrane protein EcfT